MDSAKSLLGQQGRCYVIAEVGINHNGDLDLAHKLIDVAASAGVDAVKFQNYRTEDFIADPSLTYTYVSGGKEVVESQWEMFKRYELTGDRLSAVAGHCRKVGIDFAATPTGDSGVAECVRLGAAFLKNGSDCLTHLPLIRTMGRTGLPTILSTGMATVEEIDDAIAAYRGAGGRDLTLLHCVSLYPAPLSTLDLRRIPAMRERFGCPIGFSDHSEGVTAACAAVALGAVAIERHITFDKRLPGPDHRFSADPADLRALVAAVRGVQESLGNERLGFSDAETEARQQHRLSCVSARALTQGHLLQAADVKFCRPGNGLPPKAADGLIGKRLRRDAAVGHVFASDDFA